MISQRVVFFLHDSGASEPDINIHIAEIYGTNKSWKCAIIHPDQNSNESHMPLDRTNLCRGGICYVKNFKLPSHMYTHSTNALRNGNLCDILFTFGGPDQKGELNGYIINPKEYYLSATDITAYHCTLPGLETVTFGAAITYSTKHGLIQIGGDQHNSYFHTLGFEERSDDMNVKAVCEWEPVGAMLHERNFVTPFMLNDDELLLCGGHSPVYYKYLDVCTIYDFAQKRWKTIKNMNVRRCRSGICSDKVTGNRVYVGGGTKGCGGIRSVEYYDMMKDTWYQMKDCNESHNCVPVCWLENCNVLCIGSVWSNSFERCDLRENKWRVMVKNPQSKGYGTEVPAFVDLFGPKSSTTKSHAPRLCI